MSYIAPDLTRPVVLGLDVSTKTGVALLTVVNGVITPITVTTLKCPKLRGMARLQFLTRELVLLCQNVRPTLAVIEGYGYANKNSLVPLVEIGTVLRTALYERAIPFGTMTPKTLKMWATGSGNADKNAMIAAASSRWGFFTKDNNQADAYALAVAGLAYCCAINCKPSEKELITQITLSDSCEMGYSYVIPTGPGE